MAEQTVQIRSCDRNEFIVSFRIFGSITPFVVYSCILMEYSGIITSRVLSKERCDDIIKGNQLISIPRDTVVSRYEDGKLEMARSGLGFIALNGTLSGTTQYPHNREFHQFVKSTNIFKILYVGVSNKGLSATCGACATSGASFDCKAYPCFFIRCRNHPVFTKKSTFMCFIKNKFEEFVDLQMLKSIRQHRDRIQILSTIPKFKLVDRENKTKQLNRVSNDRESERLNLKGDFLNTEELNNRNCLTFKREILQGSSNSTEVGIQSNQGTINSTEVGIQRNQGTINSTEVGIQSNQGTINSTEVLINKDTSNSTEVGIQDNQGTSNSTEVVIQDNEGTLKYHKTVAKETIIHYSTENIDDFNAVETRTLKNIQFIKMTKVPLYNGRVSDTMLTNTSSIYREDEMVALPSLRSESSEGRVPLRSGNSSSRKSKRLKINDRNSRRAFQAIVRLKGNKIDMKNSKKIPRHFTNETFKSADKHKENVAVTGTHSNPAHQVRIKNGKKSRLTMKVKNDTNKNGDVSRTVNRIKENATRVENGNVSRTGYEVKNNHTRINKGERSRLNIKYKTDKIKTERGKDLNRYDKVKGNYTKITKKLGRNLVRGNLTGSLNVKSGVKKKRKHQIKGNAGRRQLNTKHNRLALTTESYLKNEEKTARKHKYIRNTTTKRVSSNREPGSNMKLYKNIGEMNRTLSYRVTGVNSGKYSSKRNKNENLYDGKLEENVKGKSDKSKTTKHPTDRRKKFESFNSAKLKSERKETEENLLKLLARNSSEEKFYDDLKSSNRSEIAVNDSLRGERLNLTAGEATNQTPFTEFPLFLTMGRDVASTTQLIQSAFLSSDFNTGVASTVSVLLNTMPTDNRLGERDYIPQVENQMERTDKEKSNDIETNVTGYASRYGSDSGFSSDEGWNRSGRYGKKNYWKIIIIPVVATVLGILVLVGTVFLCWRCCCVPILRNAENRDVCCCQACSWNCPNAYY